MYLHFSALFTVILLLCLNPQLLSTLLIQLDFFYSLTFFCFLHCIFLSLIIRFMFRFSSSIITYILHFNCAILNLRLVYFTVVSFLVIITAHQSYYYYYYCCCCCCYCCYCCYCLL